jgi:hypothetical protein
MSARDEIVVSWDFDGTNRSGTHDSSPTKRVKLVAHRPAKPLLNEQFADAC